MGAPAQHKPGLNQTLDGTFGCPIWCNHGSVEASTKIYDMIQMEHLATVVCELQAIHSDSIIEIESTTDCGSPAGFWLGLHCTD